MTTVLCGCPPLVLLVLLVLLPTEAVMSAETLRPGVGPPKDDCGAGDDESASPEADVDATDTATSGNREEDSEAARDCCSDAKLEAKPTDVAVSADRRSPSAEAIDESAIPTVSVAMAEVLDGGPPAVDSCIATEVLLVSTIVVVRGTRRERRVDTGDGRNDASVELAVSDCVARPTTGVGLGSMLDWEAEPTPGRTAVVDCCTPTDKEPDERAMSFPPAPDDSSTTLLADTIRELAGVGPASALDAA